MGSVITFPTVTNRGLTVEYSIEEGKESIATLDGNELTVGAPGSVVITASQEGNDEFQPMNISFSFLIVDLNIDYSWLPAPAIAVEGYQFKVVGPGAERFTRFTVNGLGGNDISGSTGTIELEAKTEDGSEVVKLTISR